MYGDLQRCTLFGVLEAQERGLRVEGCGLGFGFVSLRVWVLGFLTLRNGPM